MVETDLGRRRTVEVRVKLSPEMAEAFSGIAANRGVLPASLAALALGEYVEKWRENKRIQALSVAAVAKEMTAAFTPQKLVDAVKLAASDPDLAALMKKEFTEAEGGLAGQAGSSAGPEAAALPSGYPEGSPPGKDRARTAT